MVDAGPSPLITTILPTYRRPQFLRRAIRSVLNQSFLDFQVCVYDNASGDETPSVVADLARLDRRVKYHCHPQNIGGLRNFLYGMERIETPFFSFLSDDDFLLPGFYETALQGFAKYPEAMFSASGVVLMDQQERISAIPVRSWTPGLYRPPAGLLAILENDHPTWTGILFRKEVIARVGVLDPEVDMPSDLDFELRIAAHYPFVLSSQPGAVYSIHPESTSLSSAYDSLWPGWAKMTRNLVEDEAIPGDTRRLAQTVMTKWLARKLIRDAFRFLQQKNWRELYGTAEALQEHCGLKTRALVLRSLARVCEYFPPARSLALLLNDLRKVLARRKTLPLERELRAYARLLERPEDTR